MRNQFISPIILFSLLSALHCSIAKVGFRLNTGSSLSPEQAKDLLTSVDGTFSCGFYEVGTNAYCFSIWFATSGDKTIVWTANRDSPVNGRGSRISLQGDGNLVLTDFNGSTVWNTDTSSIKVSAAELLNDGNLVLKDDKGKIVWQSFHSPTDTLLPSQPLTKGKSLTSAISKGAAQSGYYNLYFDNDNVLRLMYDGPDISSIYWPSPDYNVFENGRSSYNSTRIAVLDYTGRLVSSDGLDVRASDSGRRIKRRLTIDYDGNLRLYSLNESDRTWLVSWEALPKLCDVHGLCGINGICEFWPRLRCSCPPGHEMTDPRDWNSGCKPKFKLTCNNKTQDELQFVELDQTDFYGFDMSSTTAGVPFEACRNSCVQSCSCLGFSYRITGGGNCYPKSILFNGFKSPNFPGSFFLKVPSNVLSSPNSNQSDLDCESASSVVVPDSSQMYGTNRNRTKWAYLYGFASAFGAIELLFIIFGWWSTSRGHDTLKSVEEGYKLMSSQFRKFTYRELKEATGKFKEELGRGGSGAVYRGVLDDKRVVAVKKLRDVVQGGEEDFWAEVSVIGRINHINLVRIWGFCSEGRHRLLVCEYVENQSLDKHLFGGGGNLLGWSQRFKVALGTARGLAYLHHECLEWVIHCDVKPENILLDKEFGAKIADFGLAKLSTRDVCDFNFSRMRGTMGYMAPEWALNLPITGKVDVYSYGVVLLDIVMGRRVSSPTMAESGKEEDLRVVVAGLKEKLAGEDQSWLKDVVDKMLNGQFNYAQAMAMVKVAVSCVDEERSRRPTMDEIVRILMASEEHEPRPPLMAI